MKMPYHYILFDLDGTLTDSGKGIVASVRYAVERLGGEMPDEETLRRFVGPPLQESFRNYCGYDPELARRAVLVFRERYLPIGQFENMATPGLPELCARLKNRGCVLAVASSKPEKLCTAICERFGYTPSMTAVVGSPDDGSGKDWTKADVIRETLHRLNLTDKSASEIIMVGDRKYDVLGAREYGLPCVGVDFFGYAEDGELEAAGAAAIVKTPEELEAYLLSSEKD